MDRNGRIETARNGKRQNVATGVIVQFTTSLSVPVEYSPNSRIVFRNIAIGAKFCVSWAEPDE